MKCWEDETFKIEELLKLPATVRKFDMAVFGGEVEKDSLDSIYVMVIEDQTLRRTKQRRSKCKNSQTIGAAKTRVEKINYCILPDDISCISSIKSKFSRTCKSKCHPKEHYKQLQPGIKIEQLT